MADVVVDLVAPDELAEIVGLYNQIFRPPRDEDDFLRRYQGRYNILQMIARVQERPVGFLTGFELKPRIFFIWFIGVLPSHRRNGAASQLLEACYSWIRQRDYEAVRCECFNRQKSMLQLALADEYDIIGLRWDTDHGDNLILLQKTLAL
ncbi:MAG: GNAT family N-acetyltransferase [Gemmataceae bacterium]